MAPRSCGSVVESQRSGIGFLALPHLALPVADGVAQGAAHAGGMTKLSGQLAQQRLVAEEVSLGGCDLVAQDLGKGEVLQQRHDVGEAFMEGEHIGIGGIDELAMHAVEQGVRGLVGDDVLRKAGEDHAARQLFAGVVVVGVEVAEQQRDFLGRVVGIGLAQGVRIDAQLRDVHRIVFRVLLRVADRPPQGLASERVLEVVDGEPRDGIDHLLMELRRAFAGGQSVLRQQLGIVEVHRFVETAAAGIDVDDVEVLAARPGLQALPGDLDRDFADGRSLVVGSQAGINRKGAQAAKRRLGWRIAAGNFLRLGMCLGNFRHRLGRFACRCRHVRSFDAQGWQFAGANNERTIA